MHPSFAESIDLEMDDTLTARPQELRAPACVSSDCQHVAAKWLAEDEEFSRYVHARPTRDGLVDLLHVDADEAPKAKKLFKKLRWGGLCLVAANHKRQLLETAEEFKSHGFAIERGPTFVRRGRWPIAFLNRKIHAFVARKIDLILPGEITNRFTYHVQLVKHDDPKEPIVVQKQVPSLESLTYRLSKKHPDYPASGLEKLARKFTDKIFPTFLTREAAMLMILQEYLSPPYNARVPRLIDMEKDSRGFVRTLRMSWLRNGLRQGCEPLSHMEFARQSADLLRVLHDIPGIIHLDLRLDNMVITPDGVGFVDFGSAVRQDEDLSKNPLLQSLFGELMKTSQIQKMMEQMTLSGQCTSQVIKSGRNKPDKAADFFYLALQFNSPHANPDLAGLIEYDPKSKEARDLSRLTSEILRPKDPANPTFKSAKDILHGIERIQLGLKSSAA
ncbi:MAG TPA: phosphotransferase [Tepidisphaeraceae bacterium]|jgi:tRNA A-37 threonylcarbamoyl transferase component Bud32|nr:phosphotransferase [Tepidisphaeraceae bacterium]